MSEKTTKLLIAASGTGGHLFPAIAVAEKLSEYDIEWLGVPDRLESTLVPEEYRPLHIIRVSGFQGRSIPGAIKTLSGLIGGIFKVRKLLKDGKFSGVFTTGGYISAPTILAARSLGLPVFLHESNAFPGKVTRAVSRFCTKVVLGFAVASKYIPRAQTVYLGTPCRQQFLSPQHLDLPVPDGSPLIIVVGGSQGAVALNQMVRECAPEWLNAGATIVHITGAKDTEPDRISNPRYIVLPFYNEMAALMQRADLAIGRSGAAFLNELTLTATPSILIPYPYAAEDHQYYNGEVIVAAGGAIMYRQDKLNAQLLSTEVLDLLKNPDRMQKMGDNARKLSIPNSADLVADLIRASVN